MEFVTEPSNRLFKAADDAAVTINTTTGSHEWEREFGIVAFDWEGTAVPDCHSNAVPVRKAIERLLTQGVFVVVLASGHRGHLDRQFAWEIPAHLRQRLVLAPNSGSEIYGYAPSGDAVLLAGRRASPLEERQLTETAVELQKQLERSGLEVRIIHDRLCGRRLDLIPLPEWSEPAREREAELLAAVEARLTSGGISGGMRGLFALAREIAEEKGLSESRISTDLKHLEIALADKSDAMRWVLNKLAWENGIDPHDILLVADEFGARAGLPGRDSTLVSSRLRPALVISVGAEPAGVPAGVLHLGGGPQRLLQVLESIAGRMETGRQEGLPTSPHRDPEWLVVEADTSPGREHEVESLMCVANGHVGTRGTLFERGSTLGPATLIAGIFELPESGEPIPRLVSAPDWMRVRLENPDHDAGPSGFSSGELIGSRRTLDMRHGLLWREFQYRDKDNRHTAVQGFRLTSLHDRHLLGQFLRIHPLNYSGKVFLETEVEFRPPAHKAESLAFPVATQLLLDPYQPPGTPLVVSYVYRSGAEVAFAFSSRVVFESGKELFPDIQRRGDRVVETWNFTAEVGSPFRMERLISVVTSRHHPKPAAQARERVRRAVRSGFELNVRNHLREWGRHWRYSSIEIDGDPKGQRALRFAAYQLLSAANPQDEKVSIGARALSGNSYLGHVFWDTEIFMLPFFVFTAPEVARSLLMYRWHTLPGARRNAERSGYAGAMYAWESADTGEETTPKSIVSPTGETIRIYTGEQEHHITADVAFAVWQYYLATRDEDFLAGPGLEILIETARFWESRVRRWEDGLYHIAASIGPDEYHENIIDNTFTNELARWNLQRAAAAVALVSERHATRWAELRQRIRFESSEISRWLAIADAMARNRVSPEGVIEQFRGYFDLENLTAGAECQPGGADFRIFFNLERLANTQLIKQADVVMLLHLLWEEVPTAQREASFDYYERRTLHGSSLSPAMYALVAARLGRTEQALRYFHMAADVDLSNNMGNASGGIHAAAQGGLWQAVVFGFAGMRCTVDGLVFQPQVPAQWGGLRFQVLWKGQTLAVSLTPGRMEATCRGTESIPIRVGTSSVRVVPGETRYFRQETGAADWQEEKSWNALFATSW